MEWKQERPSWCPHKDCQFLRRAMDDMCGGKLPIPTEHEGQFNTHRFCMSCFDGDPHVDFFMVNDNDLQWLRWIFDAMDGMETSWLSKKST